MGVSYFTRSIYERETVTSGLCCIEDVKEPPQVWDNFWQLKAHPLKMIKYGFYFTSKALSVFKIFEFLSWLFGHVAERLD